MWRVRGPQIEWPFAERAHARGQEPRPPSTTPGANGFKETERVRFELTSRTSPLLVFETSSFNRSDTSPKAGTV